MLRKKTTISDDSSQYIIDMYETSWSASDDSKYKCPDDLYTELNDHKDLGLPMYRMLVARPAGNGLAPYAPSGWTCNGEEAANFNFKATSSSSSTGYFIIF